MSRLTVLVLAIIGAAWIGKVIVGPVVSGYLAHEATTVAELERALAWDPGNPDLHLALAQAYQTALEEADLEAARVHLQSALRLRPTHAGTWFRVALLADRGGDRPRARQALETALRYAPHNVALRWESALVALRWGDRAFALDQLRYVLAVDPERREVAFHLARSLLGSGGAVASLLPSEPEPLTGILQVALKRRDFALARAAWERRAAFAPAVPPNVLRQYVELLIEEGDAAEARRLWLASVPNGRRANVAEERVWNGGFENEKLLGWGFDWQVERVWGVEVSLDRFIAAQGRQSLRLVFNSGPTLDYAGVFQVVPVESGRRYRLRALARAIALTSKSGVKLQVVTLQGDQILGETRAISGTTTDWISLEGDVRVPENTSFVRCRVRREKSVPYDEDLKGKVWLDEVSLTPLSPQGHS